MNTRIKPPPKEIVAFCKRWQVNEISLFGSVLREDFGSESDIDVLVRFTRTARHTLLDVARMQGELSRLLGRPVDLVERSAVEASRNHIRRDAILRSAETIYAA